MLQRFHISNNHLLNETSNLLSWFPVRDIPDITATPSVSHYRHVNKFTQLSAACLLRGRDARRQGHPRSRHHGRTYVTTKRHRRRH